jgi:hypothetical protein
MHKIFLYKILPDLNMSKGRPKGVLEWSNGATDNASAYGAEDSRFESWLDRFFVANLEDEKE